MNNPNKTSLEAIKENLNKWGENSLFINEKV